MRLPTLKTFAQRDNPFDDRDLLIERLRMERTEGRYLEWKATLPIGREATRKHKYRFVKAAISLANTDGGFIVVGVDPAGNWQGLDPDTVRQLDQAHFAELLYDCCTPDFGFDVLTVNSRGATFLILFVPASPVMPHITTKEVRDNSERGRDTVILSRHTLYCRRGAKSDLASPADYERIVDHRAAWVRDELVRRVREIPVPTPFVGARRGESGYVGTLRVADDPHAIPFRKAGPGEAADATVIRESIDDGVFEDATNLARTSMVLSSGAGDFGLDVRHYYRLYAERESVETTPEAVDHFFASGFNNYAPVLYWLTQMPDERVATQIQFMGRGVQDRLKDNRMYHLARVAALLGDGAEAWLKDAVDRAWGRHPQPPAYVLRLLEDTHPTRDPRLRFLNVGPESEMVLPWSGERLAARDVLAAPHLGEKPLSDACRFAFQHGTERTLCRNLDVLVYGETLMERGEAISKLLEEPLEVRSTPEG